MCHYYEGYHTAQAWEIEAGDDCPNERREELAYDLPWRVLGLFFGVVVAVGAAFSVVIGLLA